MPEGGIACKIARIRVGMNQYELAGKIGLPVMVPSEIENGTRAAPPNVGENIDTALEEFAHSGGNAAI